MRQLMHDDRNHRVSLVVRGREGSFGDGAMVPCCSRLSPSLGGDLLMVVRLGMWVVSLAVEVLYYGVGDLSQIARHALCDSRHSPPTASSLPRRMPVTLEATAARQARASQLPCLAQVVGSPAGFHMFAAVSVRRHLPQLSLPTPTVRSWGTLLPVLRPRRYPYWPYLLLSSFPPPFLFPPSPVQDHKIALLRPLVHRVIHHLSPLPP